MKKSIRILLALGLVAAFAMPHSAQACAACFGKSDSPMAQGMNAGIFALLGVIGTVLTGAASFFVYLAHRASSVEKQEKLNQTQTKEAPLG